jgi:competence protein ComEC
MYPSLWLASVCIGFLCGVGLVSFGINPHPFIEGVMLVAVFLCVSFYLKSTLIRLKWPLVLLSIFVLAFGLGVWRLEKVLNKGSEFVSWYGQTREFEGLVVERDLRSDILLLSVRPDGFDSSVQFRLPPRSEIFYGDRVFVKGKITEPKNSPDFDYQKFLSARGVGAVGYYPKILVLSSGHGNLILRKLFAVKELVSSRVSKRFSPDEAGLILGVLVGSKQSIGKDLQDKFTATGLTHILVASGYNLTVVAAAAMALFWWVGRRKRQFFAALAVILFVGMAGAGSAVLRAGVMAGVAILSRVWGRQYAPGFSLLLAAGLMVLVNPYILAWDAGFQLSFAATFGIIFFSELFDETLGSFSKYLTLGGHLSNSLAAILATLPIITYHFERVALFALPANLLVVPFVPVLMLLGVLTFVPLLGNFAAVLTGYLSSYILWVVNWFSLLNTGVLEVKVSILGVIFGYVLLVLLYVWLKKHFLKGKMEP